MFHRLGINGNTTNDSASGLDIIILVITYIISNSRFVCIQVPVDINRNKHYFYAKDHKCVCIYTFLLHL